MTCEGCKHLKCIPMVCRGSMDCDTLEEYCEIDCDYDGDGECPKYEEYVEYTKEDYDEEHYDERHDR